VPKGTKPSCSVDGCDQPCQARAMCQMHYARWRRGTEVNGPMRPNRWHPAPPTPCGVNGCGRDAYCRGWCRPHYTRWLTTGSPASALPVDPAARFWAKVNAAGPLPPYRPELGRCWIWMAAMSGPYGTTAWGRGVDHAHRVAYIIATGPIPTGLVIDHLCEVALCVNPAHLEAVTQRENVHRRRLKSCCRRCGGPYKTRKNGRRYCPACLKRYQEEYAAKSRQSRAP
jgi:hypothetical protein